MKRRPDILHHPVFLSALGLLLLNDMLLKSTFPGAVTGKLSDVAGVFAFTAFGLALFPQRRSAVMAIAAVWFMYWKSPFSQPLIDAFNRLAFYRVGRVKDYSDLWALAVIPLAAWIFRREKPGPASFTFATRFCIPLLCLFAFCSTSRCSCSSNSE